MTGSNSGNIIIGHAWGIPLQINPSTFLILGLITWSLAGGILPGDDRSGSLVDRPLHRASLFRVDPFP
jgi:hypothetical protein